MADQLQPNFLVVNPDGTISAALSGSLRLPADVGNAPLLTDDEHHSVSWADALGRIVASMTGIVGTSGDRGIASQSAYTPDGSRGAQVRQRATPTFSTVQAEAWNTDGGRAVDIIDAGGHSAFLQLANGLGRVVVSDPMTTGTTGIVGPGVKAQFTLNHGLGTGTVVALGAILGSAVNNPSGCAWSMLLDGLTTNSLKVEIQNVSGAATFAQWTGVVLGVLP